MRARAQILAVALGAFIVTGCASSPLASESGEPAANPMTTLGTIPSPPSTMPESTTTTKASKPVVILEVIARDAWGARPPDRDLEPHSIRTITVHHTARPHDETPMPARLLGWQEYHQASGFGDIAYHAVVGSDGTIYLGRDPSFVGATRTDYDPTGHFLPALDGMFDESWDDPDDGDAVPDGADELSDRQVGALVDLLAWAAAEYGIDPASITGHRDHAATACPGSLVHAMIESGALAGLVKDRLGEVAIELRYVTAEAG